MFLFAITDKQHKLVLYDRTKLLYTDLRLFELTVGLRSRNKRCFQFFPEWESVAQLRIFFVWGQSVMSPVIDVFPIVEK